ncbi:MAG: hypothetical protein K9K67_10975 [Bacteriovoracaceae bacterium]|nr:hypothetical protein [Bacteriovoracaceae bacterium]
MKALFVCDEIEDWDLLKNIFHAHFSSIELLCVSAAKEALDTLMFEGPFGLIILECSIKESDPTLLAEEIYETIGERPLIFVGTAAMIKDRVKQEFFDTYDMVTIYNKPYKPLELKNSINEAINWAKQLEYEQSVVELDSSEFLPLKLRNFYLYDQVPFDVYIELTKTKYLKAITAHKKYTQSIIQDFQKRNIKYLYLEKNEHLNFLENSIKKISQSLYQTDKSDRVRRLQTLVAAVLVSHQYIKDVGVSDSLKEFVDLIIINFGKVIEDHTSLQEILLNFPIEHGDLAEQAVLKGIICEFMVRSMGWRSDLTRSKTGLASILHDIFLEREEWSTITYKDHPHLDDLTELQRKNFIDHPFKAAETSRYFSNYADVDFIIEQHHEQPDGTGFPRGINSGKITKVSAIFIIANNLVIQVVINGITPSTIQNIMQSFKDLYLGGPFKEPFNHLIKELKRK